MLCSLGIRGKKEKNSGARGLGLCWFIGNYSASVDKKKGGAFPGDVRVSGEGVVPYILFAETYFTQQLLLG